MKWSPYYHEITLVNARAISRSIIPMNVIRNKIAGGASGHKQITDVVLLFLIFTDTNLLTALSTVSKWIKEVWAVTTLQQVSLFSQCMAQTKEKGQCDEWESFSTLARNVRRPCSATANYLYGRRLRLFSQLLHTLRYKISRLIIDYVAGHLKKHDKSGFWRIEEFTLEECGYCTKLIGLYFSLGWILVSWIMCRLPVSLWELLCTVKMFSHCSVSARKQ